MQQFAYRYVTFRVARTSGQKLLVFSVDGEFERAWESGESLSLTDYSNKLGEEGWELTFFEPTIAPVGAQVSQLIAATAVFMKRYQSLI